MTEQINNYINDIKLLINNNKIKDKAIEIIISLDENKIPFEFYNYSNHANNLDKFSIFTDNINIYCNESEIVYYNLSMCKYTSIFDINIISYIKTLILE